MTTAGQFDIVVAGSGAAGMTAALTAARRGLRVVVIEKAATFGGSTARSGGGIWVPGNEVLRRAGVADTAERARAYLAHVAGDGVAPVRQQALLAHGPAMVSFVREHTPLEFAWVPGYADYYPEAPGGVAAGRSIEPVPLNARVLGPELARLNPPYLPAPEGVTITQADYRWLSLGPRHPRAMLASAKIAGRMARGRLLRRHTLSMGQALAAGLRAGLLSAQVPVWLNTPLTGLEITGGRVTGARVIRDGQPAVIAASRGVVLAAGGFERNGEMRRRYQRQPIGTEWTTGAAGNTGDAILAGEDAGAALDLMEDAWWGPSIPLPSGPYFCLAERSLPGCLLVNGAGQRFVNEAAPYVDTVHAMYDGHSAASPHIPCWLIFDQRYKSTYVFAGRRRAGPFPGGGTTRGRSTAHLPSPSWPGRSAWTPRAWTRRWPGSASSRRPAGRGLSPRRLGLRPLLRRPAAAAEPEPGAAGPAAVLRRQDRAGRSRHQGRPGHRRAGPGAPRRRLAHPRALRGG